MNLSGHMFNARNDYIRPQGWAKIFAFDWLLLLFVSLIVILGVLMLYAVAGGEMQTWARPQLIRFGLGVLTIFILAFLPVDWLRFGALGFYLAVLAALAYTMIAGEMGGGAERWISIGPLNLQPSEFAKLAVLMLIATYYSIIPVEKVSNPLFMIFPIIVMLIPAAMVLVQPDLGTALFILILGAAMMFVAGVSIWYFIIGGLSVVGIVGLVFKSRGTNWQLIHDYQFARIDAFLNPELDPSGAGYHGVQSKIALGSGGLNGRGWLSGTQSQLQFLPENHTDFIFTSYAESFGFLGTIFLLSLYFIIGVILMISAIQNRDRFLSMISSGVAILFFIFYFVNMGMVMGLLPIVGVPLPMFSYGGSQLLMLCLAVGLAENASVHRPRARK